MADLSNPAQIKRYIEKGLRSLVDPEPTKEERALAFAFFSHQCAYCGNSADHLDHLLAESKRGANHVSNRAPACSDCNAKQKRDLDWRDFLQLKCGAESALLEIRRCKIEQWIRDRGGLHVLPDETLRLLEDGHRQCAMEYDAARTLLKNAGRIVPREL